MVRRPALCPGDDMPVASPENRAASRLAKGVPMRFSRRLLVLAAAAAACAVPSTSARAGDAPPAAPPMPKPVAKIDHPLLDAFVGSWNVSAQTAGGEGKGVSRVRRVAGGTALLQETQIEIPGHVVRALS